MCLKLFVIAFVLGILTPAIGYTQSVFIFQDSLRPVPLASRMEYYIDAGGNLGINTIQDPNIKFLPLEDRTANFGKTQATVWLRFAVRNATGRPCFLQLPRPMIHYLDIYLPENGGYRALSTGALRPWYSREINSALYYTRLLVAGQEGTFYVRLKSDLNLDVPFTIGTVDTCMEIERKHNIQLVLMGALVALTIFNIFIWLLVRERSYLFYSFCLLFKVISLDMLFTGIGFQFMWPHFPQFNLTLSTWIALSFVFTTLFAGELLNTRAQFPGWHKALYFFYVFAAVVVVANISGLYFLADLLDHFLALSNTLLLFALGIVAFRSDVKMALYFLIALFCLIATIMLHALYVEGVIPSTPFSYLVALSGNLLEALMFAFALAHKIRTLREQHESAQADRLEMERRHNDTLAKQVQQRTEEIAAQNEELIAQQEQISFQNELLHEAKSGLEKEVAIRMDELLDANRELVGQNNQLEQFAFIIAHNLRAPVARIQGLGNLLSLAKTPDESLFINEKIRDSTGELNAVLTDLARILDIRKGTSTSYETLDILECIAKVRVMLREEIRTSGALFDVEHAGDTKIFSLAPYLESILYNLISNAIKYRSPDRLPAVHVSILRDGPWLKIRVQDNGLGINMQRYGKKLFGLYQRFHLHLEGKGMGLHLVKLQTESIGGKIVVESAEGSGTTFEIDIPVINAPQ
jgi:signal transduction histidine kinase